jgi:hypothetical protein
MPYSTAETISPDTALHSLDTSGGRVRFSTDSGRLTVKITVHTPPSEEWGTVTANTFESRFGVDVYEDTAEGSTYCATLKPRGSSFTDGTYEAFLDFLSAQTRSLTLYFPLFSQVSVFSVGVENGASVSAHEYPYKAGAPVVWYGSSIVEGGCVDLPGNTYAARVCRELNRDFVNLGMWGSARGETAMANYIAGLDMSAFVLQYDHNSSVAELASRHKSFFDTIRAAKPELPILMDSRPSQSPDADEVNTRRAAVQATYDAAVSAGDTNVWFVDGQSYFEGENSAACLKGVHPSDRGAQFMAQKLLAVFDEIFVGPSNVYISPSGADTAEGSELEPVRTLARAVKLVRPGGVITVTGSVAVPESFPSGGKPLTMTGGTLDFTALNTFKAQGDLTFKDTAFQTNSLQLFFANGHRVVFDVGVSMSNRITVYGGSPSASVSSTDLTIRSGSFQYIYGGNRSGDISCDTSVRFEGGNVLESIYGGNAGGVLTGSTHITMTGGKTQALFGGSSKSSMSGNTFITVAGGEVTRRIFGGCYNDFTPIIGGEWKSAYYVSGTTNIEVGPGAEIATSNALEDLDKGIYGGSRCGEQKWSETEINTVILLEGCNGKFASALSPTTSINPARQHIDHLIEC